VLYVWLLQVTRLCDLSSETDSVTSVSWNERVWHWIFGPFSLSVMSTDVDWLNITWNKLCVFCVVIVEPSDHRTSSSVNNCGPY